MSHSNKKWRVVRKIGQGEHGTIYLVDYTKDGKKGLAALKRVTYSSKLYNDF
jgi:hypothetical protein